MAAKSKKGIIGLVICAVLLVAILIVSIAVGTNFENIAQANATAVASVTRQQASLNGMQGGRNIEREGAVLLKNENDTLPLGDKGVTLLGTRSHHYVLGGTGSAGGRDDDSTVMMNTAFGSAGINYNQEAWTWLNNAMGGGHATAVNNQYVASADSNRFSSSNWTSYQTILEFSRDTYEQFVTDSVIGDYDTAIVTLGRTGAEGASPSLDYDGNGDTTTGRHYLELSDDEKDLLAFCAENFESTVVLLNSAVPIEMGFIDNPAYNIDAAMWIGHPGEAGMHGVADILKGNVNPSGHLVDTYAYDLSTNPTFWSANDQAYTNVESASSGGGQGGPGGPGGGNSIGSGNKYYQYNEGIYVGYRYYETADAMGYFDTPEFEAIKWKGNLVSADKYDEEYDKAVGPTISYSGYEEVVQFPFGYGMSYTTFTQEIVSGDITMTPGGLNTITVRVTNTGDTAGKDVVQLYLESPYSMNTAGFGIANVGLEQSKVSLVGFGKTQTLEPNAHEDITITFATDDLATYDQFGQGCYVLTSGTYTFHVSPNAHGWANDAAYGSDYGTVTHELSAPVIYKSSPSSGTVSGATYRELRTGYANGVSVTEETSAVNRMNDITAGDGTMLVNGGADGSYTLGYLSRSNFHLGMRHIMSYQSDDLMGVYNGNGYLYDGTAGGASSVPVSMGERVEVRVGETTTTELRRAADENVAYQISLSPNTMSTAGINGETGYVGVVGQRHDYGSLLAEGISFGDGNTGKYLYGYGNDGGLLMKYTPDSTFEADGDTLTGVLQTDPGYAVQWSQTYYVALDSSGDTVKADDGYVAIYTSEADAAANGTAELLQASHMDSVPMDDTTRWNQLANMLSYYEADALMGDNQWRSAAAPSIGKPMQIAVDGPGEPGNGQNDSSTWFPCAVIVAATWNPECAFEDYGECYGDQAVTNDKPYCYAPAMNTHRTPFGGRSFEYYSEDGFIAGVIGGSAAAGIMSRGAHVFIKHYALNDSDTNRGGVCTWADEASIRTIYAKPYEIAAKYYKADGIMGSLNRMGMAWSHHGFYKQMTRDEWGWNGMYITDGDGGSGDQYNNYSYWTINNYAGLLGGGKICETGDTAFATAGGSGDLINTSGSNATNYVQYVIHYVGMTAAYQYGHNIDIVNYEPNYTVPTVILAVVDGVLLVALLVVLFAVALPGLRKKEN